MTAGPWKDKPAADIVADMLAAAKLAYENTGTQMVPYCPPHRPILTLGIIHGHTNLSRCVLCGATVCVNCGSDKIGLCTHA